MVKIKITADGANLALCFIRQQVEGYEDCHVKGELLFVCDGVFGVGYSTVSDHIIVDLDKAKPCPYILLKYQIPFKMPEWQHPYSKEGVNHTIYGIEGEHILIREGGEKDWKWACKELPELIPSVELLCGVEVCD
jgi:hypothetical protein